MPRQEDGTGEEVRQAVCEWRTRGYSSHPTASMDDGRW